MGGMSTLASRRDSRLHATVISEMPLVYRERSGRRSHVRAGSSLAWFGRRLAVVQDDTRAVALIDPATGRVRPVPLPEEGAGKRRGAESKRSKLDLEACTRLRVGAQELLLVFGSGSRRRRRVIAALLDPERPRVRIYPAGEFYALLERSRDFTGGALNVEGALWDGDSIRLVNRGNRSRASADATCEIEAASLLAWLTGEGPVAAVRPRDVRRYDLGQLEGLPLTFTDVAAGAGGRMLYAAAAEDTADAVLDGAVAGSALGVIGRRGGRWTEIRHRDGSLFRGKVEGICPPRRASRRLWVVTDADDPREPARLCAVRLGGPW